MIKLAEEIKAFKPIDTSMLEARVGVIPEDMKQAIAMFNKAVDDIQGQNQDMAIIALRKAISLHPAFYEAMNLMGLCQLDVGEEEKARKTFERVIALDDSSIRASRYLDVLDGNTGDTGADGKSRKAKHHARPVPAFISRGLKPENAGPWIFKYIAGFLLGVLAVIGVWMLAPTNKPLIDFNPGPKDNTVITGLEAEKENLQKLLNGALADLEIANSKEQAMKEEMEQYKLWTSKLYQLEGILAEGRYRDVVVEVEQNMQGLKIPEDIEKEIARINEIAKPKAVKQLQESAKKLYDGNAKARDKAVYTQSAEEYMLAINIMEQLEEMPTNALDIYYAAGKAIALSGSPSLEEANSIAIETFQKAVDTNSTSKIASYARARIAEIDSGKTIKH